MDAAVDRRSHAHLALALCAVACLYVFPYQSQLNNPNENVRFYMTASLVESRSLAIDGIRRRWGWVNDCACVDRDGTGSPHPCEGRTPPVGATRHYYSVKAPGTSYLGVPGYALYRWLAGDHFDRTEALWATRLTGTILPWLLFAFFFYRWLERRIDDSVVRNAVFVSLALGSPLYAYATMLASHTSAAACAFGAFMLLSDARRAGSARPASAFLAGLLAAGASLFEYPCFFVSSALAAYALWALAPRRRLLAFALGALGPTVVLMSFQHAAFGNAFSPGHLFVETPQFRQWHHEGLFGAREFHWEGAVRLLFDRRLGMFALTPLLVLGPYGLARVARDPSRRADALVAAVACATLYVFVCFLNVWHAGWSIGPRYLVPLLPFVGWGAAEALGELRDRRPGPVHAVAVGGAVASLVACGIPSAYYPHLPPEFDYPLAHLFRVLVRDGFAPYDAANLVGLYGTPSMLPLALLGLGAVLFAARPPGEPTARLTGREALGACAVAVALLLPHGLAPEPRPRELAGIAFVTNHWTPAGHDRATRLEASLADRPTREGYAQLAAIYRDQGRIRLAEAAERHAESLP